MIHKLSCMLIIRAQTNTLLLCNPIVNHHELNYLSVHLILSQFNRCHVLFLCVCL
jgi:hypothetical protein